MSGNTQPESAAKVEEVAAKIAKLASTYLDRSVQPNVTITVCPPVEDIAAILRPYFTSQSPAIEEWLKVNYARWSSEPIATRDGTQTSQENLIDVLRKYALAAPVTPVSGNGPEPPKVEETKYLKLLRWFKLFYDFYQKDVAGKPSACAFALAEDGELQEFIRETNRIG